MTARTCPAGECDGYGGVEVTDAGRCTCGQGPGGYYGMHEQGCGYEPCPAGCQWVPYKDRHLTAAEHGELLGQQAPEFTDRTYREAARLLAPQQGRGAGAAAAGASIEEQAEMAVAAEPLLDAEVSRKAARMFAAAREETGAERNDAA